MGARVNIKTDFEPFLKELEKAGKNVDKYADRNINTVAGIFEENLKAECQKSGEPSDVIKDISREDIKRGNYRACKVGWKITEPYNARKISTAFKAIFMNYGTIERYTQLKRFRGSIKARGFINRAKRKTNKDIEKQQEKLISDIMGDLKQ